MPDSPFARPAVSHGYPLDREERNAVKEALREVEQREQQPKSAPPREGEHDNEHE